MPGACGGTGALVANGNRLVNVTLPDPAIEIRIQFPPMPNPPVATAFWATKEGDLAVAFGIAAPAGAGLVLNLYADRIDSIKIEGVDLKICEICVGFLPADLTPGWTLLTTAGPINLPVTDSSWPGTHPHAPDDQAEADARLPASLPAPKFNLYSTKFPELHQILVDLVKTSPQEKYKVGGSGSSDPNNARRSAPDLEVPGVDLLMLVALDPNIARILGLYYLDVPPQGLYDYRVVGHYGSVYWPGRSVKFDKLTEGDEICLPLPYQDVVLISPRPMTVELITWSGKAMLAPRVDPVPMVPTPLVVQLKAKSPSVTLMLRAAATVTANAYYSNAVVATASAAAGDVQLVLENSAGIDWIVINCAASLWLVGLIERPIAGVINDLNYVTFRHAINAPPPLRVPELAPPTWVQGAHTLSTDGQVEGTTNDVALLWFDGPSVRVKQDVRRPIFVTVQRTFLGDGSAPGAPGAPVDLNLNHPTLYSEGDTVHVRPPTASDDRVCYTDRGVDDGWYDYRVRGVGLFGQVGAFGPSGRVEVRVGARPFAPTQLSAIYLDPADPWLGTEDAAWAATDGTGLKLSWVWPGERRVSSPLIAAGAEFRVYYQEGRLNQITGEILEVQDNGGTSTLTTDQTLDGIADGLVGEVVWVDGDAYQIVANTVGSDATFEVNNLTVPLKAPPTGTFRISLSTSHEARTDYRHTVEWAQRLAIEPAIDLPAPTGLVTGVTGSGDEIVVETDATMSGAPDGLVAGVLVSRGVVYRVSAHDTSTGLTLTLAERLRPDDTALAPAVTDPFTYYPGVRYTKYISGVTLTPADGEGTAVANVGVTTSDNQAHVADDAEWSDAGRGGLGGRAGNESLVTTPIRVVATRRTAPDAPVVSTTSAEPIYADPADFYGLARYEVSWAAVTGASSYNLFRTTAARVFTTDREQRRAKRGTYTSDPFYDDADMATWLAENYSDLDSVDDLVLDLDTVEYASYIISIWEAWSRRFYGELSDSEIQTLADINPDAFERVNAEPITENSVVDSFPGRGEAVYLYRVCAVDASGNQSALSDTLYPIHLTDVTPPATPTLLSIVGGENCTTLTWRANAEPDLAGYRIWSASSAEALVDVRAVEPTAEPTPTADAKVETWTEEDLSAGTRYYRIAAYDNSGNQSAVSAVLSAVAVDMRPPEPPTWERGEWIKLDSEGGELGWTEEEEEGETYTPAVALGWLAEEAGLSCALYRKLRSGRSWSLVEDGIAPVDASDPSAEDARRFTTYDQTAETDKDYVYRVRATDTAGNFNNYHFRLQIVEQPE